jgi:hypothetical protein
VTSRLVSSEVGSCQVQVLRLAPEGSPAQARRVALAPWMTLCSALSSAGRLSVHARQIVSEWLSTEWYRGTLLRESHQGYRETTSDSGKQEANARSAEHVTPLWGRLQLAGKGPNNRSSAIQTVIRQNLMPKPCGSDDDIHLFYDKLRDWEDYYNYHRSHGALDGRTATSGFWTRKPLRACHPSPETLQKLSGGEGGIRTHVPELPDHPISSRRRCDHFGTSPRTANRQAAILTKFWAR